MPGIIQPSFARGEIGPDLYGRVDVPAYRVAVRTAENVTVHAYGGLSNRPGLKFVAPCRNHSQSPPRLFEFKYNTDDTYILEFGHRYMRVIRNDALVLDDASEVINVSNSKPAIFNITLTRPLIQPGTDIYITSIGGMPELDNRFFKIKNPLHVADVPNNRTTLRFELVDQQTGEDIDTSSYGSFTGIGVVSTVYELETPYNSLDIPTLKYVQSANVLTLTHRGYQPRNLSRNLTLHNKWALTYITFAPSQPKPISLTATAVGSTSGETYNYRVTAVDIDTLEESLPAEVSVVSGSTPNVTLSWAPNDTTYDWVSHYSVYREENGLYGWIGDTETTTFTDKNIQADLTLTPPRERNPFTQPHLNNRSSISHPAVANYFEQRRVYGATGFKPDTTFYSVTGSYDNMTQSSPRRPDDSITATLNSSEVNEIRAFVPLNDLIIFTSGSEWRVSSGSDSLFSAETLRQKPQSSWGSSHLRPIVVGDKILFVTANQSYVRSLGYQIEVDGYNGNDMTVFAPHIFSKYKAIDWAFSSSPDPVISVVREDGIAPALTFNPEQEVVAWTRWKTKGKFKQVASIQPNATEVDTATYFVVQRRIKGHEVYYIERTHTRRFKDVRDCFFVDSGLSYNNPINITNISRTYPVTVTAPNHGFANGDEVDIDDIKWVPAYDKFFNETMPDHLNGRRYYVADATADTFQLVKTEERENIVNISWVSSENQFILHVAYKGSLSRGPKIFGLFDILGPEELNGKVYSARHVGSYGPQQRRIAVYRIDSPTNDSPDPYILGTGVSYPCEDGRDFATYDEGGTVRKAVTTLSNLWHLEGEEVVILADGNVITGHTVSNGQITLSRKASRVHVGLRYTADIETLNPENFNGSTIQHKKIRVPTVTVRLKDTRGLLIGPHKNSLKEIKQREFEKYGQSTELLTGDKEVHIPSDWRSQGRVFMRQIYPLPLTLTAFIPELDVGGDEE